MCAEVSRRTSNHGGMRWREPTFAATGFFNLLWVVVTQSVFPSETNLAKNETLSESKPKLV